MNCGRLTRVAKGRGDYSSIANVVAVWDSDGALALLKNRVGVGDIEDLGRISEALLRSLQLHPGRSRVSEWSLL